MSARPFTTKASGEKPMLFASNPNHSHEDPAGKKYVPSPTKSAYTTTFYSTWEAPRLREVRGKYARPAIMRPDT